MSYQGCTGTLVGDRVVVIAGHCVIFNQGEWQNGAQPQLPSPPSIMSYAFGADVDNPAYVVTTESIHLHPDISRQNLICHDAAIIILAESVLDNYDQVVPLQTNREPLEQLPVDFVGEELLQGGFGSLDGTYDFSPIRHWALIQVNSIPTTNV